MELRRYITAVFRSRKRKRVKEVFKGIGNILNHEKFSSWVPIIS